MTGTAAGPEFDVETAASRASAFVYGNILVLAALIALSPGVVTVTGVAYVLGTGVRPQRGEAQGGHGQRTR
jgi:hypothetical protein